MIRRPVAVPRTPGGYSLLELIVAIGIFSLVMLVVIVGYLSLISNDRRARATNELNANLTFAVESMMRNIRTGSNYSCGGGGDGTCDRLSFTDSDGQTITYRLRSDNSIGQCTGACLTDLQAIPLTGTSITITTLRFNVRGSSSADTIQPQVTAIIKGTMTIEAGKTATFVVQSGATQRLIDL